MQKWGSDRLGKTRFRCKTCKVSASKTRKDISLKRKQKIFHKWLLGKNELESFADKYRVTTRTLHNWFTDFWFQSIEPKNLSVSGEILIIDGYVLEQGTVVLLVKTTQRVIFWHYCTNETYLNWHACLSQLRGHPESIVCDGQKGMLKAIRQLFPRVKIQRCHFHIQQRNRQLLTMRPERIPAIEFNKLVKQLPKLKYHAEKEAWLVKYQSWNSRNKEYLREKTYILFDEIYLYKNYVRGKRKWFYTHKRLRGAVHQIRTALPNLFHHLDDKKIPTTTNHIEGGINSQLKEKLRNHRGMNIQKRRYLVSLFLSQKQSF